MGIYDRAAKATTPQLVRHPYRLNMVERAASIVVPLLPAYKAAAVCADKLRHILALLTLRFFTRARVAARCRQTAPPPLAFDCCEKLKKRRCLGRAPALHLSHHGGDQSWQLNLKGSAL
jgi:hypothetical protein